MFSRCFKNYVRIHIRGPQLGRFLNLCAHHNVLLTGIESREDGYFLSIRAADFFRMKDLLKKTGTVCRIVSKKGPHFWLKKQGGRKGFLLGPVLVLFLLWYLSGFLWAVDFIGNQNLTEDVLKDFLAEQGITYGMPLEEIPLSDIKAELRREFERINWVSVSVEGTCLQVRIKENDVWERETEGYPMDLISPVKGVVEKVLIRQGVAPVKSGDSIEVGAVLIEGKIPVLKEDGSLKRIQYCPADGDVWIRSEVPVRESFPRFREEKEYTGDFLQKGCIEFFGQRWGLDFRPIPYENYDVTEEKKEISLLEEIKLPFSLCTVTYREYRTAEKEYTPQKGEEVLKAVLEKKLSALEEKGVQIIQKNVRIVSDATTHKLLGSVEVRYKINQKMIREWNQ